jgi:hypothetical protein
MAKKAWQGLTLDETQEMFDLADRQRAGWPMTTDEIQRYQTLEQKHLDARARIAGVTAKTVWDLPVTKAMFEAGRAVENREVAYRIGDGGF